MYPLLPPFLPLLYPHRDSIVLAVVQVQIQGYGARGCESIQGLVQRVTKEAAASQQGGSGWSVCRRCIPEPEDAPASSSCPLSVQNPAIPPSQSSNLEVLWDFRVKQTLGYRCRETQGRYHF